MGMRTIRWRNGQCPGRNGQWAERIAHAGSEAVRLVPFSSLPAVILDYLLSECCVSAWRLPLCRDAVRIRDLLRGLSYADASHCVVYLQVQGGLGGAH